ncbi:basic-leucine zipper transcription factor family protein [Striga asiatica]|uniref:Basic-leucine zipper transcription factor family protein n=1 Tax=Striga asiatica TaxID=4170 RepID=A0A5A7PLH2_STRAF|nr:basic-leucine zipper transcription factor family protein [Striga asiatica]
MAPTNTKIISIEEASSKGEKVNIDLNSPPPSAVQSLTLGQRLSSTSRKELVNYIKRRARARARAQARAQAQGTTSAANVQLAARQVISPWHGGRGPVKEEDMSFEEFLVQAGVMGEAALPPQQQMTHQQYPPPAYAGAYGPPMMGPTFVPGPVMGMGAVLAYQQLGPQVATTNCGGPVVGPKPKSPIPSDGAGPSQARGRKSVGPKQKSPIPKSPVPSNGAGPSQARGRRKSVGPKQKSPIPKSQVPLDGAGPSQAGGRKSEADGPNREAAQWAQKKKDSNRQSAARSRARKRARTVELEEELNKVRGELNELRQENKHLKQVLINMPVKRKAKAIITIFVGEMDEAQARAQPKFPTNEESKELRRTLSCFL